MSASHNPGGPDEDFGIKFNYSGGEARSAGGTATSAAADDRQQPSCSCSSSGSSTGCPASPAQRRLPSHAHLHSIISTRAAPPCAASAAPPCAAASPPPTSGEPAPEKITDKIYGETQKISVLKFGEIPDIDLSKVRGGGGVMRRCSGVAALRRMCDACAAARCSVTRASQLVACPLQRVAVRCSALQRGMRAHAQRRVRAPCSGGADALVPVGACTPAPPGRKDAHMPRCIRA